MNAVIAALIGAFGGAAVAAYWWHQATRIAHHAQQRIRELVAPAYQHGGALFVAPESPRLLRVMTPSHFGEVRLTTLQLLRDRSPRSGLLLDYTRHTKPADVDLSRRVIHLPEVPMVPMADEWGEEAQDVPVGGDLRELGGWLANPGQRPGVASNFALTTFEATARAMAAAYQQRQALKGLAFGAAPTFVFALYLLDNGYLM